MKIIILTGPSGVGKSTIALRLTGDIPSVALVDIDEIRRTVMPDYREQREESLRLAHERATEAVETYLKAGNTVIIDKAILGAKALDRFSELGKRHGAQTYELFLFADKATVQKRADERGYRPGSLLTRERVGELWEKANVLRFQRPDSIVIDTTDLSPEDAYVAVKTAAGVGRWTEANV